MSWTLLEVSCYKREGKSGTVGVYYAREIKVGLERTLRLDGEVDAAFKEDWILQFALRDSTTTERVQGLGGARRWNKINEVACRKPEGVSLQAAGTAGLVKKRTYLRFALTEQKRQMKMGR